MKKTGRVLSVNKNVASISTSKGDFVKVKITGESPNKGDIYTGHVYVDYVTYLLSSILAIIIIICSTFGYLYLSVTNSIIFDIPPAIKIKTNRWNYIISCTATTPNGIKIINSVNVKNKPLNEGLRDIADKAIEMKFLSTSGDKSNGAAVIYINGNTNPELTSLENYIFSKQVRLKINYNGQDLTPNRY